MLRSTGRTFGDLCRIIEAFLFSMVAGTFSRGGRGGGRKDRRVSTMVGGISKLPAKMARNGK